MAEGNSTYKGLAVPLWGESEINQESTGNDILTLTRLTGGTDDFLVLQDDGDTEIFTIGSSGSVTIAGTTNDLRELRYLNMGTGGTTTAPTTGLSKGDMMMVWSSATNPTLGACVSVATQLVQYITGFNAGTLGIAST